MSGLARVAGGAVDARHASGTQAEGLLRWLARIVLAKPEGKRSECLKRLDR